MRALVLVIACGVAACSTETAPTDAATRAERTDPKGNPLKNTLFDAQGEALKKARGVDDTLARSAAQRHDQAEDDSD